MRSYKVLDKQVFTNGEYSIVPIRNEDRYAIMNWRNEQIYHLRQAEPLTEEQQNLYFSTVISSLFDQKKPNQILFSFLKKGKCIGYGGLVHINWVDKNAEISFIMDTQLEKEYFRDLWTEYLRLIEEVAFEALKLHKLYVYAFDIRPHLYNALTSNDYFLDATLKGHCFFGDKFIDVVIHSKIRN